MAAGKPWPILRSDQKLGDAQPIQPILPCTHSQDSFHTLLQPKFLFKEPENVWRTSKIPTSIRAHFLFITQLVEDGLVKVLIRILSVCNIVLGQQHGTREGSGSRLDSTLILTSLHCASLIFICTERECGVSSMPWLCHPMHCLHLHNTKVGFHIFDDPMSPLISQ